MQQASNGRCWPPFRATRGMDGQPLLRAFALERLAGVGLGAATARLPDSLAAEGRALCRLFDQEVSFQPSG
jgi:hypothetical protein